MGAAARRSRRSLKGSRAAAQRATTQSSRHTCTREPTPRPPLSPRWPATPHRHARSGRRRLQQRPPTARPTGRRHPPWRRPPPAARGSCVPPRWGGTQPSRGAGSRTESDQPACVCRRRRRIRAPTWARVGGGGGGQSGRDERRAAGRLPLTTPTTPWCPVQASGNKQRRSRLNSIALHRRQRGAATTAVATPRRLRHGRRTP